MKPKDNGLANLHDRKREERGFCCMQLIIFLTDNGVKSWDEWHRAHTDAARGECRYRKTYKSWKDGYDYSCIAEYVRCVFDNAKVNIKDENAVSVDIEVTGKNELHSLEGLKELEYYFKDYDIRIW